MNNWGDYLEIEGLTKRQMAIADLLWVCESQEEVSAVLSHYGHEAVVVQQMMIASAFDRVKETDLAQEAISKILERGAN